MKGDESSSDLCTELLIQANEGAAAEVSKVSEATCIYIYIRTVGYFCDWKFREMLDQVVRIKFCLLMDEYEH